jgi:sugar/nucleoside kinase (ribokinase family)
MPEKLFDVVVIGEINPDLILTGDVVPVFGQVEKLIESAKLTIGSSAVIFACGIARLGLKTTFIGKVGNDDFGRFMTDSMHKRGIDTSGVVVDQNVQTGLTIIFSAGNDRAILTYAGAMHDLKFSDIDLSLIKKSRHIHLGSYYMQDGLMPDVPRLFDIAHEYGLTISLDTNYDPSEKWNGNLPEVLKRTDIFLPNTTECIAIAHQRNLDQSLEFLSGIVKTVAVKMGCDGAMARRGNEIVKAASIPVEVVDTVGAGDSFDAGFIYGHLNGWEMTRALKLAAVCGSLSTREAGGTAAQPDLNEALTYLE